MEDKVITVTSPLLPSLDDFIPYLQDIWNRKWLTNNGHYHQELEKALCEYLKVPFHQWHTAFDVCSASIAYYWRGDNNSV